MQILMMNKYDYSIKTFERYMIKDKVCFSIYSDETSEWYEVEDYSYLDHFFEIDDNIAPIIKLLNEKGYKTEFCCGGHITENNLGGYIKFKNEYNFHDIPSGWYCVGNGCSIRYDFDDCSYYVEKIERISECLCNLYDWADELEWITWEEIHESQLEEVNES